jgi:hypothetical protein
MGDHYQKKCGMFFETSYLLLSGSTHQSDEPQFSYQRYDNLLVWKDPGKLDHAAQILFTEPSLYWRLYWPLYDLT